MTPEDAEYAARLLIATELVKKTGVLKLSELRPLKQIPDEIIELTWLKHLNISQTDISDLSIISEMRELMTVEFSETLVRSLQPLENLAEITKVECSNTAISDLTPLANKLKLQILYCWNTELDDISPLSDLQNLASVDCSGTFVTNLYPLRNKSKLRILNCSRNEVASISQLGLLQRLEVLYCNKTLLSDLPHGNSFPCLANLEISEAPVHDLSMISTLQALERLDCGETRIRDLMPLKALARLRSLNCSGCHLDSLPPEIWDRPGFQLYAWKTIVPDIPKEILSSARHEDCVDRVRIWYNRQRPPEIRASVIPEQYQGAIVFMGSANSPFTTVSASSDATSGSPDQKDIFASIYVLAIELRDECQKRKNRLSFLEKRVDRLLLSMDVQDNTINDSLFWIAVNGLRTTVMADIRSRSVQDPEYPALPDPAAALTSALVSNLNVYVAHNHKLSTLDAASSGPLTDVASESLEASRHLLSIAVDTDRIIDEQTADIIRDLDDQLLNNPTTAIPLKRINVHIARNLVIAVIDRFRAFTERSREAISNVGQDLMSIYRQEVRKQMGAALFHSSLDFVTHVERYIVPLFKGSSVVDAVRHAWGALLRLL